MTGAYSCVDPEYFLKGGGVQLQTRGGPTNFTIAKIHSVFWKIEGGDVP